VMMMPLSWIMWSAPCRREHYDHMQQDAEKPLSIPCILEDSVFLPTLYFIFFSSS
jgi:hypothetical protein